MHFQLLLLLKLSLADTHSLHCNKIHISKIILIFRFNNGVRQIPHFKVTKSSGQQKKRGKRKRLDRNTSSTWQATAKTPRLRTMLLSIAARSQQFQRTGVRCVSQLVSHCCDQPWPVRTSTLLNLLLERWQTPRNRLSQMFIPTSKEKVAASNADAVASHSLMLKSGFIRQARIHACSA